MKNQKLFVTDFQQDSKTHTHSNKESEQSILMTSDESKGFLKTMMSPSKYIKTHTQVFQNTKESFLGYIINDQTKFADFNKIEAHYKDSIVNSITILNKNEKEIRDRMKKLDKLNHLIDQVLYILY